MEFVLWLVIFGIVRAVKGGVENTSAIIKGAEPPEITKFKARQASGGFGSAMSGLLTRPPRKPKKDKPPKEPGPIRQLVRAWKANTAAQAVEKMQHRHERRVQWYRQHGAVVEDERWHIRQQAKLRKQQQKLDQLRVRKGLVDPPQQVEGQVVNEDEQPVPPQQQPEQLPENVTSLEEARKKNQQPEQREPEVCPKLPHGEAPKPCLRNPEYPEYCRWCGRNMGVAQSGDYRALLGQEVAARKTRELEDQKKAASADEEKADEKPEQTKPEPEPEPAAVTAAAGSTSTSGGSGMYEAAADKLHAKAADIDSYNEDMSIFAERLQADGWGVEVTGPPADISRSLAEAAGIMRDVANSMREQGDNVARAYEAAPFAPDKDKLVRL